MAGLTSKTIAATYKGLLKTKGDNVAIPTGSTAIQIVDGEENVTPLYLTDGEVGIGTASPEELLHIKGSGVVTAEIESTDGNAELRINANTAAGESSSSILYFDSSSSTAHEGIITYTHSTDATAQRMDFAAGDTTHIMTLRNGNVGIGDTDPPSNLQIKTASGGASIGLECTTNDTNLDIDYYDNGGSVASRIRYDEGGQDWSFIPDADGTGSVALYIHNSGNVGIGETAPDANLCIGQGAGDGKALTFKSSDISHAFTSYSVGGVAMEANTYGAMLKGSPTNGGLEIQGTTEGAYRALILQGNLDGTPNNTHTASGLGAVEIRGTVEGSNTAGTIGSGKNILSIGKGLADVTVFIVDADGNYWFDGAAQTAFDSYDDAHLIRAFDVYNSPNDIIQTKFDDFLKYKKSALEDSGILYKMSPEEKAEGQTPFICGTRLQKLHNGAIWQQYTELEKMKELMYETMVELLGKEKADKKLDSHDINLLDKDLLN